MRPAVSTNWALPCVERVALVAHFHFHEGVFVAVLPLNGFFGLSSRLAQKSVLVAHVLEYHQAVVVGMDAFFHLFQFLGGQSIQKLLETLRKSCPLKFTSVLAASCFSHFYRDEFSPNLLVNCTPLAILALLK